MYTVRIKMYKIRRSYYGTRQLVKELEDECCIPKVNEYDLSTWVADCLTRYGAEFYRNLKYDRHNWSTHIRTYGEVSREVYFYITDNR